MNTSNAKIVPVILSGGSGTRLWPLSRAYYPKQLQPLHNKNSLLQETASRLTDDNFTQPLVICNQEHRFIVAEHLKEIGPNFAQLIQITNFISSKIGMADNAAPSTPEEYPQWANNLHEGFMAHFGEDDIERMARPNLK